MRPRTHRISGAVRVGTALLVAVAVAGCGEIANTVTPRPGSANQVTIELAGAPNALYAGLYEASALGYFRQTDINLHVGIPSGTQNPLTMLHDGQVLLAVASEPSVFLQRNLNEPVAGIAALVHTPLPAIRFALAPAPATGGAAPVAGTHTAATTTPRTTTTPTTTTKTSAGTRRHTRSSRLPATIRATRPTTAPTISTAPSPLTQHWPAQLQALLATPGAPTYDGLTVAVRAETITDRSGIIRRFIQALARGYRAARANPQQAISNLIAADPSLAPRRRYELAMLKAALPEMFPPHLRVWGFQREAQWNAFGNWLAANHVLTNPGAVSSASTNQLLQGQGI